MDGTQVTMESTIAQGVSSLFGLAPIITVLVLIIVVLCWFIKSLLQDAKEERRLTRDALTGNTAVISEFKEMVRNALANKS